ncbi:hypothetical protein EG329_007913 [Mollisiaceae sp. DMI_Dod_QoI]|nr:hypothetical protein EG329_007913 [Helotiales sp. DMI_Dod_QoI]
MSSESLENTTDSIPQVCKEHVSELEPEARKDGEENSSISRDTANSSPAEPQHKKENKELLTNLWTLEVVAAAFSVIFLIVMVIILHEYDSCPNPRLPYNITLNTIISILATASKSCLLYVVAAGIGQSKWFWFQETSRSLRDVQVFDNASRGLFGSIQIFASPTRTSITSLGAAIFVLAMAFDPFVQQVVSIRVREIFTPSATSSTGKLLAYYPWGLSDNFSTAVYLGLWSEAKAFPRTVTCTTGNCTFQTFKSLEWCSQCVDVTSSTMFSCPIDLELFSGSEQNRTSNCTIEIPDGDHAVMNTPVPFVVNGTDTISVPGSPGINFTPPVMNGTQHNVSYLSYTIPSEIIWNLTAEEHSNSTYLGVPAPILALGYANLVVNDSSTDEIAPTKVYLAQAIECVLSLCQREFGISVNGGINSIEVLSTRYGYIFSKNDNRTAISDVSDFTCWKPDDVPVNFTGGQYLVDYFGEPFALIDDSHSAFCVRKETWSLSIADIVTGSSHWTYSQVFTNQVPSGNGQVLGAYVSDPFQKILDPGLNATLASIAASLTKLGLDNSNETITGLAASMEAYVQVRWEWLLLPSVLVVLDIIFLIVIMAKTKARKTHIWKSSVLAVLYHGLEEVPTGEEMDRVSGMEKAAQSTKVRLRFSEKGERILLAGAEG